MRKIIGLLFLCVLLLNNVSAFEDDFQNHPLNNPLDTWIWTNSSHDISSLSIINSPTSYSQSKSLQMYTYMDNFAGEGSTTTKTNNIGGFSYIGFVVRSYTTSSSKEAIDLKLYNKTNILLGTYRLFGNSDYAIGTNTISVSDSEQLIEIVVSGGQVYSYRNGTFIRNLGTIADTPYYIAFVNTVCGCNNGGASVLIIDDISTRGLVGVNNQFTELDTEIQASYTIYAKYAHPSSVYGMVLNDQGGISKWGSLTTLNYSGFQTINIPSILGENYGVYYLSTVKDGSIESTHSFIYSDSSYAGTISANSQYNLSDTINVSYSITSGWGGSNTWAIEVVDDTGTLKYGTKLGASSGTIPISANEIGMGDYEIFLNVLVPCGTECLFENKIAMDTFNINSIFNHADYFYFTNYESSARAKTVFRQGDFLFVKGDSAAYQNLPAWEADAEYYYFYRYIYNGVNSSNVFADIPFSDQYYLSLDKDIGLYTYYFYAHNVSSDSDILLDTAFFNLLPYTTDITPSPTSPPEPSIIPSSQTSLIDIVNTFSEITFGKLDSNENNEVSEKEIQTMGNKILPTLLFIVFVILIMGIFGKKKR